MQKFISTFTRRDQLEPTGDLSIMENERRTMIRKLRVPESERLLFKFNEMPIPAAKSEPDSLMLQKKARFLFQRDKHDMIMHDTICSYASRSIVRAPAHSGTLALAYAERSRILLHTGKYNDCMVDCNRGLAIADCPIYARLVLHSRKLKCSLILGLNLEQREFDEARVCFEQFDSHTASGSVCGDSDEAEAAMILKDTELLMKEGVRPVSDLVEERRDYVEPTRAAVEVRSNNRWGRHLVAARNISCGEVVLAEPYHAVAQSRIVKGHSCCRHCLKCVWTVVACDSCDDHFFCSENCKLQAWREYHDVECGLMKALNEYKIGLDENIVLSLKIVLKAIKEAGSIENLKKLVAEIDACRDKSTRGMTNGEFCSNFRAFYSLTGLFNDLPGLCPYSRYDYLAFANVIIIVGLAKYTRLFGPQFSFDSCADLAKEPDVVFIAALLLKMTTICSINSKQFMEKISKMTIKNGTIAYTRIADYVRGLVIAPYASLINHSCNPNVYKLHTDDGKLMYFSILPIPKGQQIFECYYYPFYSTQSIAERRNYLDKVYKFTCRCDACTFKWGSTPPHADKRLEHFELNPDLFTAVVIAGPLTQELRKVLATVRCHDYIGMTEVRRNAVRAIEALTEFPFPNPVTLLFIYVLRFAFEYTYGTITITMPDKCSTPQVDATADDYWRMNRQN